MFDQWLEHLNTAGAHQWIATGALLVGTLALRWVLLRTVARAKIRSADLRRRWLVQIRSVSVLLIALGVVIIWASQLRTAALSIVAVCAALVLATKELLQCLSGGFLKLTSGSFALGDRICIKDIRGDVIDQTLLTTTILEIGPGQNIHQGTSRAVTIPNSLLLAEPVFNESFTEQFVLHTFIIPLNDTDNWQKAEQQLLKAAAEACSPFLAQARNHIARLTTREGLETPSVEPRVTLSLPQPGRVDLIVRVPAPASKKGDIEQDVLRRYLLSKSEPTPDLSDAPTPPHGDA